MPELETTWQRDSAALERIPQNPRKVTGSDNWFNGVQLFADYLVTVPPRLQKWMQPFRKYPSEFEAVDFRARDGVRLSAWLGKSARAGARDGVILIPGIYTSKDNPRIRARCLRLLREHGVHVFALDLRGVGGSDRVFTTPGWKEAQDIVDAVAEFRRQVPGVRVHLYAESLAATAALLAVGLEAKEGRKLLDGKVLAMSPYGDARTIVDLYGTAEPEKTSLGRDFVLVQKFFNGLLRLQGYRAGRFDAYVRDGAAHYGLSEEEMVRLSSPESSIARANVPVLVVHSEDDGLVPVSEARRIQAAAGDNANVRVWILPWGYHCLYEMADPAWYWALLERLFKPDDTRA